MDSTLVFDADAVRIHHGASTRIMPYDRIRDVIVSYASGYTGLFIDCSPKAILLEVENMDGEAAEIRGELSEIAPLAGELRERVRAANPAASPGSQAVDRELRLGQKEEVSRKERKVGTLGIIMSCLIFLVIVVMSMLSWFVSGRTTAAVTAIREFPNTYNVQYGFSIDGDEFRGDGPVPFSDIAGVRQRGEIEIEYLPSFPRYNRPVQRETQPLLMWLGPPLLALFFAASLILKSGIVPARIDGRLVAVRRDELEEDYFPWFRKLLEEEAAAASNRL